MLQALDRFEKWFNTSEWCAKQAMEPRIGDEDCPVDAEHYGMARESFLTVFISVLGVRQFGCRFENCHAFSTSTLEGALKHQRQHHFNHRPFHCSSNEGTW